MLSYLNIVFSLFSKIFLNPIIFIFYLFLYPTFGFIYGSDNHSFINYKRFIPFAIIVFLVWSLIVYGFNQLLKTDQQSLREYYRYLSHWRWGHLVAWSLTVFIFNIYRTGMEGNILGFIGLPILILASIFQFFGMWTELSNEFWPALFKLYAPVFKSYESLSMTGMILTVVIFNPVFIFCFKQFAEEKGNLFLNLFSGFIANILTIVLITTTWIGLLWILKSLFGSTSSFSLFFSSYFESTSLMRLIMMTFSLLSLFLFVLNILLKNQINTYFNFILFCTFIPFLLGEGQFLYQLFKKS